MHEKHARLLAAGIGAIVATAGLVFALAGRPAPAPRATVPTATVAAPASRGETLFVAQGCAKCHAFRGIGNPSGALDAAAAELDAATLELWIVAAPEIADQLSRKAREAKAPYAALPRADLEALIEWLRSPQ